MKQVKVKALMDQKLFIMRQCIADLQGTSYVWWKGESTLEKLFPFYAKTDEQIPSVDTIKSLGTNCAGLINIICRKFGECIPGVAENNFYAGGTYVWYEYLNKQNKLHLIDKNEVYPIGTLFLSPYINETDQGHLAIVTCEGTLDTLKISHSFPLKGVVMDEELFISHSLVESGYYTAFAKFEDWVYGTLK